MAKVWCYTLDTQDFDLPIYDIGSDDEVQDPKLHHLYEADENNPDLGSEPHHRLYHAAGFPIDVYKLQEAIRNFDPTKLVVSFKGEAVTFNGEDVTINK